MNEIFWINQHICWRENWVLFWNSKNNWLFFQRSYIKATDIGLLYWILTGCKSSWQVNPITGMCLTDPVRDFMEAKMPRNWSRPTPPKGQVTFHEVTLHCHNSSRIPKEIQICRNEAWLVSSLTSKYTSLSQESIRKQVLLKSILLPLNDESST